MNGNIYYFLLMFCQKIISFNLMEKRLMNIKLLSIIMVELFLLFIIKKISKYFFFNKNLSLKMKRTIY